MHAPHGSTRLRAHNSRPPNSSRQQPPATLLALACALATLSLTAPLNTHAAAQTQPHGQAPAITSPNARPNIILILADDLGYGDLSCYGQTRFATPNLDRLAASGTRFTQAYSGATVCAPSRCVLMTGLHTGHARVRGNAGNQNPIAQALRADDVTVATLLQHAGYATALIGKWGLGDDGAAASGLPRRQGFDSFYGYLNQTHAHNYYPEFLWRNETRVPLRNVVPDATPKGAGTATVRRDYSHDLFVAEAERFIRDHRHQPFFLYLALTIPHANNEAKLKGMEVPDLGPFRNRDWPDGQKGHAAMITRMDRDIGRLLRLLERLRLEDRTLVIFTSDNGPHKEGGFNPAWSRSSGPLRGIKRDHYEGGIRVPMLVRWPGHVPAGITNATPWWFADVLPTLAAVAGTPAPAGLDGHNVLPTLLGQTQPELNDRLLYWEFHEGGFKQAVRSGPWKLVRHHPQNPAELYRLDTDPAETQDLAALHPDRVQSLLEQMQAAHTNSPDWPIRLPRPTPAKSQSP